MQSKDVKDVFISHVEEDSAIALAMADFIEGHGYTTWYYERDSDPGPKYTIQIVNAIAAVRAFLLLITPNALESNQVDSEIMTAFEKNNRFVPILSGLTHSKWEQSRPEWSHCSAGASSATIDNGIEGVPQTGGRVIRGLEAMEIHPAVRSRNQADLPKMPTAQSRDMSPEEFGHLFDSCMPTLSEQDNVVDLSEDVKCALDECNEKVQQVLELAEVRGLQLSLSDIGAVINVATDYASLIEKYSHGRHFGCARIYHGAATAILTHSQNRDPGDDDGLPFDAHLAVDWLAGILTDIATVSDEAADEIATELRFAFDSIAYIPRFDTLREFFVQASLKSDPWPSVCTMIRRVRDRPDLFSKQHVSAYFFRHMALGIIAIINSQDTTGPVLNDVRFQLNRALVTHSRIRPRNVVPLLRILLGTFDTMCQTIENEDTGKRDSVTKPDVFISAAAEDGRIAGQTHEFLLSNGVSAFLSRSSIPNRRSGGYLKQVDHALDVCMHMILVGSSVDNLNSPWIEAEWRLFLNEKHAGRRKGAIVIIGDLDPSDLPASLRHCEIVSSNVNSLERILPLVKC